MNHKELAWLAVPAQSVITKRSVGTSVALGSVYCSENKPWEKEGIGSMRGTGSRRLLAVVAFIAFSLSAASVRAQTRAETLRYVTGASVNTLDPNIPGSTRESFALSLSTYDRLVSFDR